MKKLILTIAFILGVFSVGTFAQTVEVKVTVTGETLPNTGKVCEDFAKHYGWTATVPDPADNTKTIANPESTCAFMERKVEEFVVEVVKAQRVNKAAEDSRKAAAQAVDTNLKTKRGERN